MRKIRKRSVSNLRACSKGQAALEYLVTYGWGILAILVVVGALSYFGFFSPSRYLPARCNFGVQLECTDFQLWEPNPTASPAQNGRVRLQFRNNFGDDINITNMWLVNNPTPLDVIYDNSGAWVSVSPASQITLAKGNVSREFRIRMIATSNHLPVIIEDDRYTIPIIVEFRRNYPGSPLHNITGTVFATAQDTNVA